MQSEAWFQRQEKKLADLRQELEHERERLSVGWAISWELEAMAAGMARLVRNKQASHPVREIRHAAKTGVGLTLREHYAGLAMQTLCAPDHYCITEAASLAVAAADALIAELSKGGDA